MWARHALQLTARARSGPKTTLDDRTRRGAQARPGGPPGAMALHPHGLPPTPDDGCGWETRELGL